MVYPTRTIVASLDFEAMPELAKNLSDYADYTATDARTTRDTITGLDWSGNARATAVGRANSEYTPSMRIRNTHVLLRRQLGEQN